MAIFAAITFTGELFDPTVLPKVILGFFVFCGLASATYIINDIFDVKKDQLHPFKRFRPIAHGDVPVLLAIIIAILLIVSLSVAAFDNARFLHFGISLSGDAIFVFFLFKKRRRHGHSLNCRRLYFASLRRRICQRLPYFGLAFINDDFDFAIFGNWQKTQ